MPKKLSLTGFSFTRIVVIQSLNDHELQTGRNLCEYITGLNALHNTCIPIQLFNVTSSQQFIQLLSELEAASVCNFDIPIIHVECHGSQQHGLEFSDGSMVSWRAVSNALVKINRATRFNLLAIFSACFGAYFISQMGATRECPCWCVIAPTEAIQEHEILNGLRVFYTKFLESKDVGFAVSALSKIHTDQGQWFGKTAELWFEEQVDSYIRNHCSNEAAKLRQRHIYKELKGSGLRRSKGRIARDFRSLHKRSLSKDYFETFFMIRQIPENKTRFQAALKRVEESVRRYQTNKNFTI